MTLADVTGFLREIRWWLVGVAVIVLYFTRPWEGCKGGDNSQTPPQGEVVHVEKPISRTDATVPEPREEHAGRITVVVSDTVSPKDTVGAVHTREITLYVNVDPKKPPVVYGPAEVTYTPIRDTRFALELSFMVGASVNEHLELSPAAMLSVVRIWDGRAGWGLTRLGTGPAIGWEVWREFSVVAQHNLFEWHSQPTVASVGLMYRF